MCEHAQRVLAPLLAVWEDFEASRGVTLLDLQRLADQAVGALDNSFQPLAGLLSAATAEPEAGYRPVLRSGGTN